MECCVKKCVHNGVTERIMVKAQFKKKYTTGWQFYLTRYYDLSAVRVSILIWKEICKISRFAAEALANPHTRADGYEGWETLSFQYVKSAVPTPRIIIINVVTIPRRWLSNRPVLRERGKGRNQNYRRRPASIYNDPRECCE